MALQYKSVFLNLFRVAIPFYNILIICDPLPHIR